MKKYRIIFILIISASIFFFHRNANKQLEYEVVFIGDSLTFGSTLKNPEKDSFPAIIKNKINKNISVYNLGVPGAMISLTHPFSFCKTKKFLKLQSLKPDMAFIMLGTNDSTLTKTELKLDYSFNYLINELKNINPQVKIIYMIPPKIKGTQIFHKNDFLEAEIIPSLLKLCTQHKIRIINLQGLIDDNCYSADQLHLSNKGHAKIAAEIYPLIRESF